MRQLLPLLALSLMPFAAQADNLPANACQIFIEKVSPTASSHNSQGMELVVKVGWIGNGEHIQRVGFSGKRLVRDLGNPHPYCYKPYESDTDFRLYGLSDQAHGLQYGEYAFYASTNSGTVVSGCNGWEFTWVGTFFVETDKNTYWLNPSLDPNQLFQLDAYGRKLLLQKAGMGLELPTTRDDLRYYNPIGCQ